MYILYKINDIKNDFLLINIDYLSLCTSVISWTPVSFFNSSMDPMHTISSPSSLVHKGIGVPQNRLRDIAQSRAALNQLPKRFSLTKSGTLLMVVRSHWLES